MTDQVRTDRWIAYWFAVVVFAGAGFGAMAAVVLGSWVVLPLVGAALGMALIGRALELYAPEVFEEPEPIEEGYDG